MLQCSEAWATMYQLYIANKNYSSWSLRPWLLMRELRIPFEERQAPFSGVHSYDAFRVFSPTGKVPCLVDDDLVVWDSMGIIEFLAERHPDVWPHVLEARTWARCAAAEMHAEFVAMKEACPFNCGIKVRLGQMGEGLEQDLARITELWCEGLDRFGGPFLAGPRFGAVDACYAPLAFSLQTYGLSLRSARADEYAARLRALASMRIWYVEALSETLRESAHEERARQAGEWLSDQRATRSLLAPG